MCESKDVETVKSSLRISLNLSHELHILIFSKEPEEMVGIPAAITEKFGILFLYLFPQFGSNVR